MEKKLNFKNHLFLFDIDGTILDTKGAGKHSFVSAFEKVNNLKVDTEINFLGGIDNVIFKNLYRHYNLNIDNYDDSWNKFKKEYITNLSKACNNSHNWELFNKADYAIKLLYKISNIGLVTGNIKEGAMIKLKQFKLSKYFKTGSYGDDAQDRDLLVKNAIINCKNKFKINFPDKNIYLFGDTYKDVESALSNNITPVLIDPCKKNKNHSSTWCIKYHGSFEFIEIFLQEINLNSPRKEILYFC
jgi:phosphoglycolate phosphatase-like HAD superfamily hydrolase